MKYLKMFSTYQQTAESALQNIKVDAMWGHTVVFGDGIIRNTLIKCVQNAAFFNVRAGGTYSNYRDLKG